MREFFGRNKAAEYEYVRGRLAAEKLRAASSRQASGKVASRGRVAADLPVRGSPGV